MIKKRFVKAWPVLAIILMFVMFYGGIGYVYSQYATDNYREQGGSRQVIGGSLDVVSGGEIDVESGGALKIAGVAISSSAAELNVLDGKTFITFGSVDIANGQTEALKVYSYATPSSYVVVSPKESLGSATEYYAVPTTGSFTLTVDQDPGTTVTFHYIMME